MPNPRRARLLSAVGAFVIAARMPAENVGAASAALHGVNPDLLSGGLFSALDATGAFGARPQPSRARAGNVNLSKGRPPAVLDARVGANVRIGDDPSELPATQRGQAEPHIARSLGNPLLLLATFQEGRFTDSGALDCGYAVSRDGGFTWTRALIPNLTATSGGRFNRATDPVAAIGPQGDFYLQTLGSLQGMFTLGAVVVSRSTDSGATWSAPVTVFQSPSNQTMPDKNWLAVNDFPGVPNFGRLVATWTSFQLSATGTSLGNPLAASVSDDRGVTWSAPIELTPQGSSNQGSQPVFLPDGSLVVVYVTFLDPNNVARFTIQSKRSVDGGLTFPSAATTIVDSVVGWDDPDLRDGVFLPAAAVARQTGDLFVTYTAVVNGSPRVLVSRSTDRGATWSAPVVASDQPVGVSVMNPAIAVTPDGRTVSVVFMDKRNAADGHNFVDHYAANSFDGGATWQPNLRLTEMSSDIRYATATSRGFMLGDYLGVAPSLASSQPCVAIWCDTRTGDSDPFVVRFTPSVFADYGAFAAARNLSSIPPYFEDSDRDGTSSYLEFIGGTDPQVPESGNDVVFRRSSPTSIDLLWTERAGISKDPAFQDGVAVTSTSAFASGGFGNGVLPASLPPDQLPALALRSGLVWRGVRVTIPEGSAQIAARSVVVGPLSGSNSRIGVPSAGIAAINTNSRLINLSTRASVRAGGNFIVGFVIAGNKTILLRAAGPGLSAQGVSGALSDPRLTLTASTSDLSRANDNWQQQGSADAALFARLGAFPFAANSLDAALALPLGAQAYTAVVSGTGNTSGITLAEVYDADAIPGAPANPRLLNLSTRADAGTGDNALVAGFVISGTEPRQILIRAVGPSLGQFGVTGTLADPVLTLYRDNTVAASNDDWELARSSAAIALTAQRVGAFPLTAASLDAALLVTLAPGAYTAVVTSADGGVGLALVEVYDAD